MLSYAHGACDQPLLGESIGQNLDRIAARYPQAAALVSRHQGIRYNYREFAEAVDRLATGMALGGLRKGDRVGVWGPNVAEWTLTQYATAKLGVILVNINPAYRTSELHYALEHSGCRWLFCARECRGADFGRMVAEVAPALPGLERAVFFESAEWEQLAAHQADAELLRERADQIDFDDPINIQYTSGTTGSPKGATLSHHNILNNARFLA
ncbi:MAG TPA: AMP-binding protein, partial [Solirubrobacteraceae bacterium]|nr:AMP-binding protein [Solirubrobacteraceae bacterium]